MVTGGAGFIGHHLVNRLLLTDCKVVIIDNLSNGKRTNIPKHQAISFYEEDIRNKETISDIIKREQIHICVHLAAKVSVRANDSDLMSTNVDGTLSVLNACAENGVKKFVLASSAAVYGEAKFIPVTEDHPLSPISQYGISKMEAERLVSSFRELNKIRNAVCLRLFNVYGEGQNMEYAGVITKFAERIANKLPPIIYGDGKQTRDFVSVNDIVDVIIHVIEREITGIFNIGTNYPIMIKELARKMMEIASIDMQPIYEYSRNMDNEIKHSVADLSKAAKILEFVVKDRLDDALQKLLPLHSA